MKKLLLLLLTLLLLWWVTPRLREEHGYYIVWHPCASGVPTCGSWDVEEAK